MQMTYNSIIHNNNNYNNNEVLTLLIILNALTSSFSAIVMALNKTACHLSMSHVFSESVYSKMKGMHCCSCAVVSLLSWVTTLPVYVFQLAPHQCRGVLTHAVCLLSLAL